MPVSALNLFNSVRGSDSCFDVDLSCDVVTDAPVGPCRCVQVGIIGLIPLVDKIIYPACIR